MAAIAAQKSERLARELAGSVPDPELPMLSVDDLGILRDVRLDGERVVVTITPTYSGCPAMATIRDDLVHRLQHTGFHDVEVRVRLAPAWSSDWISERGRQALRRHGIAPPGRARHPKAGSAPSSGPILLSLMTRRPQMSCPRCGSDDVELLSRFGATACKALYRCSACLEPFEHVKEI